MLNYSQFERNDFSSPPFQKRAKAKSLGSLNLIALQGLIFFFCIEHRQAHFELLCFAHCMRFIGGENDQLTRLEIKRL